MGGGDRIGFFAFLPWGWLAPLGFILMGRLLWRTRVVPQREPAGVAHKA